MSNQQRGVYQPLGENLPLYDLADDEVEEERSRLPLLIVIAFIILAAFAGVVWIAYNQGVARGRAGAATVINAPGGPVRTAPDDTGSGDSPYTGLKVYGQPVPPDQEAQTSTLARPSDQTLEPAPANPVAAPPVQSAPLPATPQSTEAPPARLSPPLQAAPAAQQITTAPVTAAPVAPAIAGGAALLQIGAYETMEIANGAWAAFKAHYTDVTGGLSPDVQKVDLGAKGTWYRLRFGPFEGKAQAAAACDKLKAEGGTCFVTAP